MSISKIKVGTTDHDLTAARVGVDDVGSATQGVYLDNGVPKAMTYSLNKSVPSNAVFTDTVYTHPSYTARTGVPTSNAALSFGGTFSVSQPVSDATGHITAVNSRTYTMPSDRLFTTLTPSGTNISTTGTDLNTIDYIKVGRYYCSANATAKTLLNCPTSLAFMMEVYSPLSPTIDNEESATYVYRLRKITEYNTGIQYIQYVGSGATKGVFTYNDWYVIPRAKFTLDTTDTNDGSAQIGGATQPVYVASDGTLTACTYTLGKSVPSNAVFTDTTYSNMTAATASAAGKAGLVPAPAAGKQTSFLRGDGTWVVPTNTTYSIATTSANGLMSKTDKTNLNNLISYVGGSSVSDQITTALSGYATSDHNHGGQNINPSAIELGGTSSSHGGYIDFHYGTDISADDYTVRLIEDAEGQLRIIANVIFQGTAKTVGANANAYHRPAYVVNSAGTAVTNTIQIKYQRK